MKRKKNPLIDLEQYRTIFLLAGFAISLGIVIWIFNWKFYEEPVAPPPVVEVDSDEIVIPITTREPPKTTVEVPKDLPSQIDIIEDHIEVDDELDMSATETDQQEMVVNTDKVRYVEGEVEIIQREEEDLSELEDPIPFAVVESVPVFPGCEDEVSNEDKKACFQAKLLQFVGENYVYTDAARNLKLHGRIILRFVIEKDGSVSNIEVLRGVDPWLDDEAVRVLGLIPNLIPAKQRGKPVRMSFVVPINLVLED